MATYRSLKDFSSSALSKDLKDIKCANIDIYFDKLSTYNNMIDKGYDVFINGDEYPGGINIKSFEDLSKLYNVLNEAKRERF